MNEEKTIFIYKRSSKKNQSVKNELKKSGDEFKKMKKRVAWYKKVVNGENYSQELMEFKLEGKRRNGKQKCTIVG